MTTTLDNLLASERKALDAYTTLDRFPRIFTWTIGTVRIAVATDGHSLLARVGEEKTLEEAFNTLRLLKSDQEEGYLANPVPPTPPALDSLFVLPNQNEKTQGPIGFDTKYLARLALVSKACRDYKVANLPSFNTKKEAENARIRAKSLSPAVLYLNGQLNPTTAWFPPNGSDVCWVALIMPCRI